MTADQQSLWMTLQQMILGYQVSQAIYVASKLGIADLLKDGAKTADELAEASGVHALSLYRTLRLLASEGVFAEVAQGRFQLTPLATLLQTDAPSSLRARAIFSGEERYRAWGSLLYSVTTGGPAFDHIFGMSFYEFLAHNPQSAELFNAMMIAETAQVLTDIIDTRRSLRLELIIVFLILFEVLITVYQLAISRH